MSHVRIEPAIHYWGTPVVLVSSLNEDGTTNVAPMSSAWFLGWSCMLGLDASSKTTENLRRHPECVLNLADASLAAAVDRLALTTGRASVPLHKKLLGYRTVTDKLEHAALSALPSEHVRPMRIAQCKVQLEATIETVRALGRNDPKMAVPAVSIEARIVAVHVDPDILQPDRSYVDPLRWRPLIMSFRRLFALGDEVQRSRLARGPEDAYAPWKGGPIRALAGRALSAWSNRAYAEPDDADDAAIERR